MKNQLLLDLSGKRERRALRARALEAITQHLVEIGPKDWKPLRLRFDDVAERTWWRWVAVAKKACRSNRAAQVAPRPDAGSFSQSTPKTVDDFKKQQIRALNLGGAMLQQVKDIELLYSYAVTPGGRIKNFALFAQAVALRERALVDFAKIIMPVAEQLTREDFYDTVIEAVAATDKDVAIQIMQTFQELQKNPAYDNRQRDAVR